MVLTKQELIDSLQNEVRILLHLASKIDRAKLDYRPSGKQRSMLELLQYMAIMGPQIVPMVKAGVFDPQAFHSAETAAKSMDFDAALSAIGKQSDDYASLLGEFTDADLRAEVEMFGRRASRGSILVNIVFAGHAAYRTQLFLYLKACGREELNTMNLWAGSDAAFGTA
jgi:hypothetical protein